MGVKPVGKRQVGLRKKKKQHRKAVIDLKKKEGRGVGKFK